LPTLEKRRVFRRGEHIFLLSLWLPFAAFLVTKMLVLYETAMGYCLFKMSDSARLEEADLYKEFETPERANKLCVAGGLYLYIQLTTHLDLLHVD